MITTPMDVLRDHPARKSGQQKQAFRDAVQSYARELGYRCKTEKGKGSRENLVIGDPETARLLIAACYAGTSGVVTLLETAASMPRNLRDRVCFVLFDGRSGAAMHHARHRYACGLQTVLYLDRVGEGDSILLTPTKALKDDTDALDRLIDLERRCGEKRVLIRDKGRPARMPFVRGVRICARRGKLPTFRDTLPDYTNVNILRACLITCVGAASEE